MKYDKNCSLHMLFKCFYILVEVIYASKLVLNKYLNINNK